MCDMDLREPGVHSPSHGTNHVHGALHVAWSSSFGGAWLQTLNGSLYADRALEGVPSTILPNITVTDFHFTFWLILQPLCYNSTL